MGTIVNDTINDTAAFESLPSANLPTNDNKLRSHSLPISKTRGQPPCFGSDDTHENIEGDYRPVAGSTTIQIDCPNDPAVDEEGNVMAGWRQVDPSTVLIRGIGYTKKNRKKVESPGDLYRCVKADVFESQREYLDMASRVAIPTVRFDDAHQTKTWTAPDTFVISVSLPTNNDGAGFTITMYYEMQQDTRDILRRITADGYDPKVDEEINSNQSKVNAVRLLETWCQRAPTDDAFMSRFKVISRADNIDELGLPKWISKFNSKPFLVKRPGQTGFLHIHPEKSCMEFDVSLHTFPYLTKKAIRFMKDACFRKTVATFAFCLEGREEDELPECLLGAFSICYPDPTYAIQGEDLFSGIYSRLVT